MIAVDAFPFIKVNQLRLVGAACFEEVEEASLLFFFGIDDAECGVDLFAEAFDGVYFAIAADRALNVIVIGSIEVFLDHISCEGDLANARGTDLAVGEGGKIKGKISRLPLTVAHNEGVEERILSVNDKVAVRAFVLDVARGSPKVAVVGESYLDKLNELGRKSVALAREAVNAADADALILGLGVIVVNIAVKQGEFIALGEKFVAEGDGIAVRNDKIDTVELEFRDRSHIFFDLCQVIDRAPALRGKAE